MYSRVSWALPNTATSVCNLRENYWIRRLKPVRQWHQTHIHWGPHQPCGKVKCLSWLPTCRHRPAKSAKAGAHRHQLIYCFLSGDHSLLDFHSRIEQESGNLEGTLPWFCLCCCKRKATLYFSFFFFLTLVCYTFFRKSLGIWVIRDFL